MHPTVLLAQSLLRRARRSWIAAAAAATLATPWIVRNGVGDLEAIATTGVGATVAGAYAEPAAAPIARLVATGEGSGRHLGFDTNVYPGDRTMRAWKAARHYEWVGYYLPAPCHKDESWSGKRERLQAMGWGMAVIYVGQQTWDRAPRPARAAAQERAGMRCSADFVSADRGRAEAEDAIARTAAEGFRTGTVVYLDVERMERMPEAMRDYYRTWVRTLLADGRFVPGVYVHSHNAERVYEDFVTEYAAAGIAAEPPIWVASGRGFTRDKAPHEVGHRFAGVWQGMLDVVEHHNGIGLPIDVNVASVPSPSDQYALGE